LKKIKEELVNIYSDSDTKKIRNNEMWKMPNQFDKGEEDPQKRKAYITKMGGINYFEQNLETLLLKHTAAYTS
jgi:Fe-S-cluster formation regulator IscX/YfhJ